MIKIPFANSELPAFIQEITLEDSVYKLRFYWNTRFEYWTMSIFDFEDNELLQGIKLVINYELIQRYRYRGLPQGQLYVIDPTDTINRIGRDDMDDTLSLIYVTEEELVTI